jgi:hypothetical protein
MSWPESLLVALISGILAPMILAAGSSFWKRRRVPTALSRSVRRVSYLKAVRVESERDEVTNLDVLAPRLEAARGNRTLALIQQAWMEVNSRGTVRVLTLDSDECLKGGAELLKEDIDVRVARRELGSESLSFHLFDNRYESDSTAIINHHGSGSDQPVLLPGSVCTKILRSHFESAWERARPLASVIAERVITEATGPCDPLAAVQQSLKRTSCRLDLDARCVEKVLPHLAFQHSCSVVILIGQPGAGKSYVRRRLAGHLGKMGMETRPLTDYVYAYRDLVHALLKMQPARGNGFKAYEGGAFTARDENALAPALRALALAVRESAHQASVTLVEFARADLVGALQEFTEISAYCQLIHLSAPEDLRLRRLSRRVVPPEFVVGEQSITLRLSDDHLLPSTAERSLYSVDGIEALRRSPPWRDRIFEIENNVDDDGTIDGRLREFVERKVLGPYQRTVEVAVRPSSS